MVTSLPSTTVSEYVSEDEQSFAFSSYVLQKSVGDKINELESRQDKQGADLLGVEGIIDPPYDPDLLLVLKETNAIHSACISAMVMDTMGDGWYLEAEDKEADEKVHLEIEHQLEELTPEYSFEEMLAQLLEGWRTFGHGAWEIVRDGKGKIAAMFPMPSHTLRAHMDDDVWVQQREIGSPRYFKTFGSEAFVHKDEGLTKNKVSKSDMASEVFVLKSYSDRSDFYGVPHWISSVPTIAELTAIREFNVSIFSSAGMTDRLVHVTASDKSVAKGIANTIVQGIKQTTGRAHITIVTSGSQDTSLKVDSLNPSSGRREGQFLQRRNDLVKEVLVSHNVPPYRIGLAELGSLGGSAAREMMRAYQRGTIKPAQNIVQRRLTKTIFGPQGLDLKHHRWRLRSFTPDQIQMNLQVAQAGIAGLMSPNEGRYWIGMDPIDDPRMDVIRYNGEHLTGDLEEVEEESEEGGMLGDEGSGEEESNEDEQGEGDFEPEWSGSDSVTNQFES
jgi:PBSX family phage portal protein